MLKMVTQILADMSRNYQRSLLGHLRRNLKSKRIDLEIPWFLFVFSSIVKEIEEFKFFCERTF